MITVSHLTKKFPGRTAVEDLSFAVGQSEVVGFLGPNGSGKTTTLRILCGYLPASAGTVKVAGFDVQRFPMEVRKRIGYLPENCPLYPEMRVDEYLSFRGRLKGMSGRFLAARMEEVRALCGLENSGRRIIGQLSKGFRQRVGIADALIHDPELLILDEPTLGLDPNQIRQVRELIRRLGKRHTILLSTHILSEVEAICGRVLIIRNGRLMASDSTDRLIRHMKGFSRIRMEVAGAPDRLENTFKDWPDIHDFSVEPGDPWSVITLLSPRPADPRARLFALAAERGWQVRELHMEPGTLEELFVTLTSGPDGEAAP